MPRIPIDAAAMRAESGDRARQVAMDSCECVAAALFPATMRMGVDVMFGVGDSLRYDAK